MPLLVKVFLAGMGYAFALAILVVSDNPGVIAVTASLISATSILLVWKILGEK